MPSENRPDYDKPEYWLLHAESDLVAAGLREEGLLLAYNCFHAQQAAEKALKAAGVARGAWFPRTHDIAELISELRRGGVAVPDSLDIADILSDYAVETRYPGEARVSEEECERATRIARDVVEWAKAEVARARAN